MVGVEKVNGVNTGVRMVPGYLAMVFRADLGPSFHSMTVRANSRFGRKSSGSDRLIGMSYHLIHVEDGSMYNPMVNPFARSEVRTMLNVNGNDRWQNPPAYLSAGMTFMGPTFRKLVMPKVADSTEVTNTSQEKTTSGI